MTKCTAPIDPESIVIPKKPANKSASEHRKITKPIMEKRRRARINHSLEQLKCILIEQFSECSKKNNNLEKADILEMTVKYLKDITARKQNTRLKNNIGLQSNKNQSQTANNTTNILIQQQLNQPVEQQILGKKGIHLIQSGFKDCKQQVSQCLSKVDKQLNERLSNHLAKIEKQQFEQAQLKFDCDQVLNLSINEQNLTQFNNNANSFLLHTPSSACSSSSSSIFFPQNCKTNGGSLSPSSDRSLSPSNIEPVWRPW